MQEESRNKEEQSVMTKSIRPAMLATCSEADLLRVALACYTIDHPQEDPEAGIAALIGRTPEMIGKALSKRIDKRSHIGAERWLKIETELGVKLYREWINIIARRA